MSIRCFIAVELEPSITEQLAQLQSRFRKDPLMNDRAIRWVEPQNIHLTLKFLGEVDDNIIPDICTAASCAAEQFEPFDIEIGNCGSFGSGGSARVIWVGLTDGMEDLQALAQAVDEYLSQLDFPREKRRFNAHLTLARIKNVKTGRIVHDALTNFETVSLGSQNVAQLTVFQSQLTASGPIYTVLHHAPLT